jgi:hypothetical protein
MRPTVMVPTVTTTAITSCVAYGSAVANTTWSSDPMARASTQPSPTPKESLRISRNELGWSLRWVTR